MTQADAQELVDVLCDSCSSFISDNMYIVDNNDNLLLLGDFRTNSNLRVAMATLGDISKHYIKPFPIDNNNINTKRIYFIFLTDNDVFEGYISLFPTNIILNYPVLLLVLNDNNSERYNSRKINFEKTFDKR